MDSNKPFIHLYKTSGGYYFYDINKNANIRIPKYEWDLLSKNLISSENVNENLLLYKLKKQGFLSSNRIKSILHPTEEVLGYYLKSKVQKVTLQVTQHCNLRCDYCPFSGGYDNRNHSKFKMDFDMAKKCIDFLLEHSSDVERMNIAFYGGEPLIEFELIKKCIEYAKTKYIGKEILFSITTNGTLLDKEKIEYFAKNEVNLTLSIDGPKEIHDKNRKLCNHQGSFDIIMNNLKCLEESYPEYFKKIMINAVIDTEGDFGCVDKFFKCNETVKDINVTMTTKTEEYSKSQITYSNDFIVKNEYEYFKVLLSKLKKIDKKYVSRLTDRRFQEVKKLYKQIVMTDKLPEISHHGGPCIPGIQRLFVNVYGDFFPCEKVSESSEVMKIGNIKSGFNIEKIQSLLNIGKISEKQCKNCWGIRFCYLCGLFADELDELSQKKKISKCNSVRNYIENNIKDICVLKDLKYNFYNND